MPSATPNRRVVFKKRCEVELGAVCVNNFWILRAMRRPDLAKSIPFELEYASDEEDIHITYVEDPIAECAYVIVAGTEQDKACRIIEKKLPSWTRGEVFAAWTNAPNDTAQILAILRIGVAAPFDCDEEFASRLRDGVGDENPEVREAALAAIGYRDWPEFDQLLQQVSVNDSSDRCRNRASHMLKVRAAERNSSV